MKNKKLKIWLLTLGAILAVGLVLAGYFGYQAWRSAHPRLHQYSGESLIDWKTIPPQDDTRSYQIGSDIYQLQIKFAQPTLSPIPGSQIKGEIILLKNGRAVSQAPTDLQGDNPIKGFGQSAQLTTDLSTIRINLTKLNNYIATGSSTQVLVGKTLVPAWESDPTTHPYFYEEVKFGAKPLDPMLLQAQFYSPQALEDSGPLRAPRYGTLDLSKGKIEFEYIFDGKRTLPYLEFEVGSLNDALLTRKTLVFSDQVGKRVAAPALATQQRGDIYYSVGWSTVSIAPDKPAAVDIKISARNSGNGSINTNPRQRVRLGVLPIGKYFQLDKLSSTPGGRKTMTRVSDTLQLKGTIQIQRAGEFVEDDQLRYHYGAGINPIIPPAAKRTGGDLSNNYQPILVDDLHLADLLWIELDLIDGEGLAQFTYSGKPGMLPYLAAVVQPVDYFAGYPGWETGAAPYRGAFSGLAANWETWGRGVRQDIETSGEIKPYYRESAQITYPTLDEGVIPCGPVDLVATEPSATCVRLYGDAWITQDDFTEFQRSVYTISTLPISGAPGLARVNWLLWFGVMQVVIGLGGALVIICNQRRYRRLIRSQYVA
ncbi:MAG: hypothetical protein V1826_02635 [bacterium]